MKKEGGIKPDSNAHTEEEWLSLQRGRKKKEKEICQKLESFLETYVHRQKVRPKLFVGRSFGAAPSVKPVAGFRSKRVRSLIGRLSLHESR